MRLGSQLISALLATSAVYPMPALAGGFLEDVARGAVDIVTAPVTDTIRIIEGDDPSEVIEDHIGRQVNQAEIFANAAEDLNESVYSVPRGAIADAFGDDWARGFDIMTASNRVQAEMAFTSGRFLGQCAEGGPCNLEQITAMPLAAQMRDAYRVYYDYSSWIGDSLADELSPAVPREILRSARIAVGRTPDFTIPGMLNAGYEVTGSGHAVTIGNVMIFSRDLDLTQCSDFSWLLHELGHIEQYMRYSGDVLESIDGFAVDYVSHFNGIEDDAENTAQGWLSELEWAHGFTC